MRGFAVKWRMTGAFVALLIACSVQGAQAGDGVVALQTADPSCRGLPFQADYIYVGCGNGTVTDNRTGLVWLVNALGGTTIGVSRAGLLRPGHRGKR